MADIWSLAASERIRDAIFKNCDAIYVINTIEDTYTALKDDEFWRQKLGTSGDLKGMYGALIWQSNRENNADNKYNVFVDDDVFKRDSYQGDIEFEEDGNAFVFNVFKGDSNESFVLIRKNNEAIYRDQMEKAKIDTIQESYLFSMMIDLNKDTCMNSNTTEIAAKSQDYMELKYSDWRNMIKNMFLPDDVNLFMTKSAPEYLIRNLQEQKSVRFELQMFNMTGQIIWVRLCFNRLKGFSKDNALVVYTVQDIQQEMTKMLNQENIIKAVQEKNEMLAQADKAKTMFISNMSHEIRTPINAVLGMDEMIIREATDEKIRSYAYDIKNAGKILLSIINDILDYSKIESGKMEIIPVEYDMVTMINDVCNLISVKVNEKALAFDRQINSEIPRKLYGDDVRITQVIINLLTNAVKYTEKGTVTFSMDYVQKDDKQITLRVKVQDTGIGMKEEEMGKLFSAFERLDTTKNRNIEGTGLGMGIVVRLLEQMGSKLEVNSVYGEGSCFSFELIQKIVDMEPIGEFDNAKRNIEIAHPETAPLIAPDVKILVVDDQRTNLKVAKALLEPTQIKVDTAKSGQECLDMLATNTYDIIMLDHFMPKMDGVETLAKIREMGEVYKKLPIIALTANVTAGARDQYIGYGFNDFLEKPISVDKMEAVIRESLKIYN